MTRLTGKKPSEAIKLKRVYATPSLPAHRTIGLQEPLIPSGTEVRYLFQPGELEGGRRRADGPEHGFVHRTAPRQDPQTAISEAAPRLRLHSRQVSRTFPVECPLLLSGRSTLNCCISAGRYDYDIDCCRQRSGYFAPREVAAGADLEVEPGNLLAWSCRLYPTSFL